MHAQINNNEKNDLMKVIEYISKCNQNFVELRAKYIIHSDEEINFQNFQSILREVKSGINPQKAIINFIFRFFWYYYNY